MSISLLVKNLPPLETSDAPAQLLALLRTQRPDGLPFEHQAKAWKAAIDNYPLYLVAGTASGKTLAAAVPIFWKLREGIIHKVAFLYATIALLEDQRRALDGLAKTCGLEIGEIMGGMSRTEVVAALNKPVILATPDAIYWFFRKEVKYSGLLLYGLTLVDEWVLDEAHLFNGLSLANLTQMRRRIDILGQSIGRKPRWHVLTATPTLELEKHFAFSATRIDGKSKCGDVRVTFVAPVESKDRAETLVAHVSRLLEEGKQKVLLVLNSANLAHRVFDRLKDKHAPVLTPEQQLRFGRVTWATFSSFLSHAAPELEEEIAYHLSYAEPPKLAEVRDARSIHIPVDKLNEAALEAANRARRVLVKLAYEAAREKSETISAGISRRLVKRGKLVELIWHDNAELISDNDDTTTVKDKLQMWLNKLAANLEYAWDETSQGVRLTTPFCPEISNTFQTVGFSAELAKAFCDAIRYSVQANLSKRVEQIDPDRPVAFTWLRWLVEDDTARKSLRTKVLAALSTGEFVNVETRHIGRWPKSEAVAIIYTGKMLKADRAGLIDVFSQQERAVLISTPAVEVGVDFAADALVTEQCDGNGFLQRFGRVGRREGILGEVVTLVTNGKAWTELAAQSETEIARSDFSEWMRQVFPLRTFSSDSALTEAVHWTINEQLGVIGKSINAQLYSDGQVERLAGELTKADITPAFGLRGSLPGIALRGAGSGEAFDILTRVENERLLSGDSPFELAKTDITLGEFLWRKRVWDIGFAREAALITNRAILWKEGTDWHIQTGFGLADAYLVVLGNELKVRQLVKKYGDTAKALQALADSGRVSKLAEALLQLGEGLVTRLLTPEASIILAYGDLFIERRDREAMDNLLVVDKRESPLMFSDQMWLLIAQPEDQAWKLLENSGVFAWQELIVESRNWGGGGILLGERSAGACMAAYEALCEAARKTHVG